MQPLVRLLAPVLQVPVPPNTALQLRIAAGLQKLSRGQREAFVLVHLEGFTVSEAATALGKAPGTIKSHLHRAVQRLRLELADLREETERRADEEKSA